VHIPSGEEQYSTGLPKPRRASTNHRFEGAASCKNQPLPNAPRGAMHVTLSDPRSGNGGPHRSLALGLAICLAGSRVASRRGPVRRSGSGSLSGDHRLAFDGQLQHAHGDALHRPSLVFLTTGVKLRGPEGAQRPRVPSASTSELGGSRWQHFSLRTSTASIGNFAHTANARL
jgi:hypothetical protein